MTNEEASRTIEALEKFVFTAIRSGASAMHKGEYLVAKDELWKALMVLSFRAPGAANE